jgi:hypothetical protein
MTGPQVLFKLRFFYALIRVMQNDEKQYIISWSDALEI